MISQPQPLFTDSASQFVAGIFMSVAQLNVLCMVSVGHCHVFVLVAVQLGASLWRVFWQVEELQARAKPQREISPPNSSTSHWSRTRTTFTSFVRFFCGSGVCLTCPHQLGVESGTGAVQEENLCVIDARCFLSKCKRERTPFFCCEENQASCELWCA